MSTAIAGCVCVARPAPRARDAAIQAPGLDSPVLMADPGIPKE